MDSVNTKIGPVLEVTTCCLQGKYGVEIRIKSVNKDNSHSWVRSSHGLNKLVTNFLNNKDQDDNEQEPSEMQFEEYALKLNASDFASRSKAKAKPQRRDSASSSTRTIPNLNWYWTTKIFALRLSSVEETDLLRHGSLLRDNDGAIEFCRIKDYLQDHFVFCHHWSDEKWKSAMAGGRRTQEKISVCADSSGTILYLRALQGHSGRNLIDPSLQDNVVIPDGFFKYIYHVGCAINLHSIINSRLRYWEDKIWATGRRYSFCLWIPMDKEHKHLDTIDLRAPRHAQYMHGRNIKTRCVGSTSILLKRKGLKFCQMRSNAVILHDCIPKVVRTETGEVIYEKVYASPMKQLGSEVARRPEGEVVRQAKGSQPTQPNPNPNHDGTGRPVVCSENTSVLRKSIHVSLVIARTPI